MKKAKLCKCPNFTNRENKYPVCEWASINNAPMWECKYTGEDYKCCPDYIQSQMYAETAQAKQIIDSLRQHFTFCGGECYAECNIDDDNELVKIYETLSKYINVRTLENYRQEIDHYYYNYLTQKANLLYRCLCDYLTDKDRGMTENEAKQNLLMGWK